MGTFHDRMAEFFKSWGLLGGRLAIVAIFAGAAFNHITGFSGSFGYMKSKMSSLPDPLIQFLLAGAILFLVAGSLMLALGWQARMGALLLLVFIIAVTPIFHAFWAVPEEEFRTQMIAFQKNMAIAGGLLAFMAAGAGPFGLDRPQPEAPAQTDSA